MSNTHHTGTMPVTTESTVTYYDASREQYVTELETRLSSLEEDFSKLLIYVNEINNNVKTLQGSFTK
jgi:hypothetical protein